MTVGTLDQSLKVSCNVAEALQSARTASAH